MTDPNQLSRKKRKNFEYRQRLRRLNTYILTRDRVRALWPNIFASEVRYLIADNQAKTIKQEAGLSWSQVKIFLGYWEWRPEYRSAKCFAYPTVAFCEGSWVEVPKTLAK